MVISCLWHGVVLDYGKSHLVTPAEGFLSDIVLRRLPIEGLGILQFVPQCLLLQFHRGALDFGVTVSEDNIALECLVVFLLGLADCFFGIFQRSRNHLSAMAGDDPLQFYCHAVKHL